MTKIKCYRDLHNGGRCFTKGKVYESTTDLRDQSSIIDATVINDLGERHVIGMWWKNFRKI